eukprot:g5324.t1
MSVEKKVKINSRESKRIIKRLRKRVREWHKQDSVERYGVEISDEIGSQLRRLSNYCAMHQAIRDVQVAEKCFKMCIEWMAEEPTEGPIQGWATYLMGQLCADHDKTYGKQCRKLGALKRIFCMMKEHRLVPANQWMGLKAIFEICGSEHSMQQEINDKGGIDLFVTALRNHPGEKKVQYYGFLLLANMIHNNPYNMVSALQAGAGRVVGMGMNNHQSELQVLRHGAYLISVLSFEHVPLQRQIIDAMGLVPLVQGLCAYIRDETLQRWGSLAICNICEINGANQQDLIDAECQRVLVFIMQAHKNNVEIQENCIAAFGRIGLCNLRTQVAIMKADGVRQIVKAMRTHKDTLSLQIHGAHAIDACGTPSTMPSKEAAKEVQNYVIDSKAHNAMFAALNNFPDAENLAISSLRALGNLGLRNETTQKVLVTDGVIQLAIKIMERFPRHAEIQLHGSWVLATHSPLTLNNISVFDAYSGKSKFLREDVIECLLNSIRNNENNVDTVTMAFVALGCIGFTNPNNTVELTHRGSITLIDKILKKYKSNDMLFKWAHAIQGHTHSLNYNDAMATRSRWLGREKPPGPAQVPSPLMLARNAKRKCAEYYVHESKADLQKSQEHEKGESLL